jgi:hypothetical protein
MHLYNPFHAIIFYKYYGAMHLLIPVRPFFYKYFGAMHLSNPFHVVIFYKYFGAMPYDNHLEHLSKYIIVRCTIGIHLEHLSVKNMALFTFYYSKQQSCEIFVEMNL